MTPSDRHNMGLDDVSTVSVKLNGEKGGILDNVHLKVSENYKLEFHIDTDDANAHMVKSGDSALIIK